MNSFPEVTYTYGRVLGETHYLIGAVIDELAEQDIDHAIILEIKADRCTYRRMPLALAGLARQANGDVLAVACDGQTKLFSSGGIVTEHVDEGEEGPSDLVTLRCINEIAGTLYAAGMGRHVYRQEPNGQWVAVDQGLFVPADDRTRPVGINSIDGRADGQLVAVGWHGEVMTFDGHQWAVIQAPTNVVLTSVVVLSGGEAIAAGMAGLLLRGRESAWSVIPHDDTSKDFWGLVSFREQVFVSNYDGVFRLDGDSLASTQMPDDVTSAFLATNGAVLLSIGDKDLMVTRDGRDWQRVDFATPEPAP